MHVRAPARTAHKDVRNSRSLPTENAARGEHILRNHRLEGTDEPLRQGSLPGPWWFPSTARIQFAQTNRVPGLHQRAVLQLGETLLRLPSCTPLLYLIRYFDLISTVSMLPFLAVDLATHDGARPSRVAVDMYSCGIQDVGEQSFACRP